MIERKIPYVNLARQHAPLVTELQQAIAGVIASGQYILGEAVEEFERQFAALCGARYAVGVGTGTDAIILALRALNIGPGDEVITPPNSFIATTSSIVLVGATPVFVDVDETLNIDPNLIERAITPRTKAILPVHLTGRAAAMDGITAIANRHNLLIVEDCAQAVLAEHRGQRIGAMGDAGCFSLHPLKNLNACGDGGIITTQSEALANRLRELRNLGLRTRDDCVEWSVNSRLDTLQAAVLLAKLKYLEQWTQQRRVNAQLYAQLLADVSEVQFPVEPPGERLVYQTLVVQAERRDALKDFLADRGIGTAVHYPRPIHLQTAAAGLGYRAGDFPVAEAQARRILSLPVYPELERDDVEYIADAIRSFYAS